MKTGIPSLDFAYQIVFLVVIIILLIMAMFCLVRAIIGPRITDRIVSVNMIGTMVMVIIAIFSVWIEGYLADICLIYAMISFLAVIVLSKLYTGVYLAAKKREDDSNREAAAEIDALVSAATQSLEEEMGGEDDGNH